MTDAKKNSDIILDCQCDKTNYSNGNCHNKRAKKYAAIFCGILHYTVFVGFVHLSNEKYCFTKRGIASDTKDYRKIACQFSSSWR